MRIEKNSHSIPFLHTLPFFLLFDPLIPIKILLPLPPTEGAKEKKDPPSPLPHAHWGEKGGFKGGGCQEIAKDFARDECL